MRIITAWNVDLYKRLIGIAKNNKEAFEDVKINLIEAYGKLNIGDFTFDTWDEIGDHGLTLIASKIPSLVEGDENYGLLNDLSDALDDLLIEVQKSEVKVPSKKTLIAEDLEFYNEILGDVSLFNPVVVSLKDSYEGLDAGPFTDEIFQEIKKTGIKNIVKQYNVDLQKQLDDSGIKNANLRRVALSGTEGPLDELVRSYNSMISFVPKAGYRQRGTVLRMEHIMYSEGEATMSDDIKQYFKENYCSTYLSDALDHEIYKTVEDLAKSINKYLSMCRTLNVRPIQFGNTGVRLDSVGLTGLLNLDESGNAVKLQPKMIAVLKNYDSNR